MARSQRALNGPEIIDIDDDGRATFGKEESLETDQDKAMDEIIGEFEASDDNVTYRASINKVPDNYKKGGKEEWCADIDSSQIAGVKTFLRDHYGPGVYRIRVFKNSKLARQFDYHIARPAIVATPATENNPAMSAIMEQMREQGRQIQILTDRLIAGNSTTATPVDPFVMMERMSNIMKNMTPPVAAAPAETSLDTFMKAAEFARDMQGSGGDGDSGWTGIVKALITSPNAGEIVSSVLAARNQPMQRRPGMQGNRPMLPQQMQQPNNQNMPENIPVPEHVSGTDPQALGNQLQANIRYLIGKAEKGSDPGLYAEWLLDNTDQNIIVPMMQNPATLDQLQSAFPRLARHRAWFEELVQVALDIINGNNEGHDATGSEVNAHVGSGGEGGDDSNPQDNGETGSPSAA